MKKTVILILCALCMLGAGTARTIEAHYGETPSGYNFWLSPPNDTTEAKPLVVFLHGKSLCGKDLNRVKRYGTIDALERGREIDAYVVAPQNPGGAWNAKKIMDIVEWVEAGHNVDSNRIYVLGMSLGGSGTVNFTAEYPDRIAAALAMCGGGYSSHLADLNKVPLWIVHGLADTAVPVSQSESVVNAMKKGDPDTPRLIYEKVPGVNHSQPARMFYIPAVYEWLFSHSLDEPDRPLHEPAIKVTQEVLSSAYSGIGSKPGSTYSTGGRKSKKAAASKSSSRKKGKSASRSKKGGKKGKSSRRSKKRRR